jgi:hypothetical protein
MIKSPTSFRGFRHALGVTLVELMVAMVIAIFLIGGMLVMFTSGRGASLESERLSRIQENIRFTSDYLVRELRNAGFRDQLSLSVDDFDRIGANFAQLNADRDEITIRLSGAGSCAEPFAAVNLGREIVNRYFIENGELRCTGSVDGGPDRTVALASGVVSMEFDLLCPDPGVPCACTLWAMGETFQAEEDSLNASCHGVDITLVFESPGDAPDIEVTLRAAFRNVILGRMLWASIPEPPA